MKKQVEVEQTLILVHCRIDLAGTPENAKKINYYEVRAKDNMNAPDFMNDFDFAMYRVESFVGKLKFEEGMEIPDLQYFKVGPPKPYHQYDNRYPQPDNFNITNKEWNHCPFEVEVYKQNGYWTEGHFRSFKVNGDELVSITRDEAKTRLVDDGNRIVVINKHDEPIDWILNIFWLIPGIRIESNAFMCTQNLEVK